MPRVGHSPLKKFEIRRTPQRVTACTLVHIPHLDGYWEQAFDVLQICLDSMVSTTRVPFDLFVLDNGSCGEVHDYLLNLKDKGVIQALILPHENLGKAGGWNVLFPACPGDFIAYCDSDILFRPNWLEKSLEIFEVFDDVGMVTARPFRAPKALADSSLSATYRYAETAPAVSSRRGQLISETVLDEHRASLGSSSSEAVKLAELDEDVELARNGTSAFAYAGLYQFVVPREVALRVLPLDGTKPLGGEGILSWDERINALGKLRLSTPVPLVRHLGNRLTADELEEASHHAGSVLRAARPAEVSRVTRVLKVLTRVRAGRALLRRIYLTLFDVLRLSETYREWKK